MTPEAQAERDAIVAWLRGKQTDWNERVARYRAAGSNGPYLGEPNYTVAALAIQRGDHLQPPPE